MRRYVLTCVIALLLQSKDVQAFMVAGPTHLLPKPLSKDVGANLCILNAEKSAADKIDEKDLGTEGAEKNPVDELSDERKANLFQFLLRDLEVEGIPLLGCDADQVHALQGALWTTMGQLSESDSENKACLVLENIPVDVLRTLVDDFVQLKTETRLMDFLPELQRFNLSLLGKGVGPAILIEAAARNEEEKTTYSEIKEASLEPDETKWTAAMKSFTSRMANGPDVQPGPVGYRLTLSPDVCDVMSAFWTGICELLARTDEELSSIVLCLPPLPDITDPFKAHDRFAAVSELLSRSLCLYRGQDLFEIMHMHPLYDRDSINPKDKLAHGHLPPTGWLRAMLQQNGNVDEADKMTSEDLSLQNYQRRSPMPAVSIKRVVQLDSSGSAMVKLDLGDGRIEEVSGIPTYSRNAIRLAKEGKENLQSAVDAETALSKQL